MTNAAEADLEPGSLSLSTLLRGARNTVASRVRDSLADAGYTDLPPNGPFVLGAVSRPGLTATDVCRHLGVTKQTTGQLIDLLATRGYLHRTANPLDRRRLVLRLTGRGAGAAADIHTTLHGLEHDLRCALGDTLVDHTRETLRTLMGWSHDDG